MEIKRGKNKERKQKYVKVKLKEDKIKKGRLLEKKRKEVYIKEQEEKAKQAEEGVCERRKGISRGSRRRGI